MSGRGLITATHGGPGSEYAILVPKVPPENSVFEAAPASDARARGLAFPMPHAMYSRGEITNLTHSKGNPRILARDAAPEHGASHDHELVGIARIMAEWKRSLHQENSHRVHRKMNRDLIRATLRMRRLTNRAGALRVDDV